MSTDNADFIPEFLTVEFLPNLLFLAWHNTVCSCRHLKLQASFCIFSEEYPPTEPKYSHTKKLTMIPNLTNIQYTLKLSKNVFHNYCFCFELGAKKDSHIAFSSYLCFEGMVYPLSTPLRTLTFERAQASCFVECPNILYLCHLTCLSRPRLAILEFVEVSGIFTCLLAPPFCIYVI